MLRVRNVVTFILAIRKWVALQHRDGVAKQAPGPVIQNYGRGGLRDKAAASHSSDGSLRPPIL